MKKMVGFDQKILLHQLDFMAKELTRSDKKELSDKMDELLLVDINGTKSRHNAKSIIFRTWLSVDEQYVDLQKRALHLFSQLEKDERLALHWGLLILAYPFFKDLITEMGNFFRLQDEVSSEQIGRKMKGLYGDRRRIEVATGAVLMSLRSWDVIEAKQRNIHKIAQRFEVRTVELKQWIAEVMIRASVHQHLLLGMLNESPMFFPFNYKINQSELNNDVLTVTRQGLDMVMVGIK